MINLSLTMLIATNMNTVLRILMISNSTKVPYLLSVCMSVLIPKRDMSVLNPKM